MVPCAPGRATHYRKMNVGSIEHVSQMNDQYKLMVFIIPDLNEYNYHLWGNFTYEVARKY
jgi:hypothetical protein